MDLIRILLSTTAAVAAMALTATPALAQSLEVSDESNGGHCSDVVEDASHEISGGCVIHLIGEDNGLTFAHTGFSEIVTSNCAYEFVAHVDERAHGYFAIDDTTIATNPSAGCVVTPCDEPDPAPHPEFEWPISVFEAGGGQEAIILSLCIRPFNGAESVGNTFCTLILNVTQTDHQLELTANDEPCMDVPTRELSGHWITESEPEGDEVDVELEHIHYPTD